MAIANKNILITPNTSVGSPIPSDPNIVFSASDGGSPDPGALDITLFARPVSSGTLSFEGTAGQLFSITNDLTGTIFSVNDISGIPSIEVEADGTVRLAEFDGNVGIGTGSPAQKLSVVGTVRIIDTGKTDYVDFSHDGTDFNTTFVGSPLPDWNISNQKTLVVSSSVTTSADNLLELNSRFYFRGDGVFNWGNAADYGVLSWNTGRAIIGSNNGHDLELDPSSGIVRLDGAASLRIMDTGETDYVNFSHDGTDFNIAGTNTADINATSGITAWNFPVITLTTALDETYGGTGQITFTTGDILYASGANVLAKLAVGSNTEVLTLAGGVPTWAASASGTNAFGIVTGDSGTITSDKVGDTVQITGGTSITTSVTGSPAVLVITNDAPNVDQNLWLNIASDVGGPVAANTTTDTLTIAGGKNVRTNIAGDTVTVNMTGSPFEAAGDPDQNLWLTVAGDSGSTAANITTDTLTIAGGTGITTAMSGDTLTVTQDTITLGTNTAGDFVGTITGGVGIDSTGATTGEDTDHTLSVDLGEVTAVVFDPAVDFMPIIDGGITGTTQKDAWTDIATAIAGTGITATSGVLAADNVGTITGSGGNNQLAVFSSASNIDSSAVLTTNDTQLTITSAAPFVKFDETGTVGSPIWWWGADGGNMSLRLNNAGPYAYTVSTSAGNNTITAQSWNGADNWVASFASGAQLRIIDTGETDYINIQHDGTDVNFTHNNTTDWNITGLSAINVTATSGGEMLLLTDSGGAGGTANPFIGFDDSANVRQGYVGFGSGANQDMYLVADIGDIRFVAGGGQVIFETDAYIPDNISLQLGTSADVDMQFNATNLVMTGAGQWQITGFTGGIQAGTIDADFDAITGTSYGGILEADLVQSTGTPLDNQIAVWTSANTLEGTSDISWNGTLFSVGGNASFSKTTINELSIIEQAAADVDVPTEGQIWVKDDAPNNLYFTDDTGQDIQITNNGVLAGGDVTASDGANNRLAVFSTATNVEGDPALLWGSPATLTVSGDLKLTANNQSQFFATFRMGANTLEIFGSPGNMLWIQTYGVDFITRKGGRFVAYETANSNFVELYHDGTDGVVAADGTSGLSFEADYHAFNGEIRAAVSTTSQSSLNIPTGTAPSAPAQGDIWVTASDILARINGVSESLLSGGGGGSPTSASTFTVVDESTDTTTFPVFVNSATGANQPKTGSNLTFNSSTGDLSATLIAGIANANLLDKSTTETVSGSWDISGTWTFLANHFGFNDTVGTRYGTGDDVTILWDGVDLEITGAAANQTINFRDGHHLTLWDSGDTDNVDFHHDGTNFNIAGTNTTDINIQPLSGEDGIVVQANGGVQLYYNNVLTAHTSVETLSISANDSSPTTSSGQLTFRLADGTTRSYLGYSGSDTFAMNSSSNSAHVHIGGNDAAGSLRTFLLGDPDATTEIVADTDLTLTVAVNNNALVATGGGAVTLYYNNSAKLATATDGIDVTGDVGGTTIGGITEANLVDKAATEAITGTWTLDGAVTTSDFGTGGQVKDGTDVSRPIGFNTIPVYEIDAADTFDLAHNGMMWHKDAGGVISFTCNNDTTIPTGASYLVHNDDTEDLTIAEGTATIEFLAPGAAPVGGDVTVEQGGLVTVYKYTDAIFWVWGAKAVSAAGSITVTDESADTTCFPTFVTAATGDLPPKTGTNLTFNSSTGLLTATTFSGNLSITDESADTTCFPLYVTASGTQTLPPKSGTNFTFNSSTGDLSATLIAGIANAQLVAKNATETISGTWTHSGITNFSGENTTTAGGMTYNDSVITHYGTGEDFDMYFNGTDMYMDLISGADWRLRHITENMIVALANSSVTLYNNGVDTFRTQAQATAGNTSGAAVNDHADVFHDVGFNDLTVFNDNVSDTLEAGHCGKVAFKDTTTARTLTLEASGGSDFPVGGMTTVINAFTSTDYTITEGATTTLYYLDGTTRTDTTGGCTLGPGGVANIWREAAGVYYIWGTGITA